MPRSTLLFLALIVAVEPADELHLTDGSVLEGRLHSQSKAGYKFLETDAKRPRTVKPKSVEKLVLTYALPDSVYEDPSWSPQMLEDRLARQFSPEWGEMEFLRSEHYIVFTNSSAGKKYLETMEDIYERFSAIFPFEEAPDARLMPVFLFRTRQQYIEFTANITGWSQAKAAQTGGHAWRDYYATYYDAPGASIHYHEGAHQLVHNRLDIPTGGSWFQEGMAVFFEGTVFSEEDPAKGIKSEIRSDRHTPLPELMALESLLMSSSSKQDPSLGTRRYRQSGSLIKFLVEGPHRERFGAILERVKNGEKWPDILRAECGVSVEELEEQWAEYYGA
jgi:hypothetical protein